MDAIDLLCELRDEVRDWEEALSGERPSLTELPQRIDQYIQENTQ